MREGHLGLNDVELGGGIEHLPQLDGLCAETVGQQPQNSMNFFPLLLLERHDVIVDFHRAQRLEVQAGTAARAAMNDSGNGRAVLRLHDQHVAAVAIGHHLILQIPRRLFAAQVRLERGAQAGPLLAKLGAKPVQLGARRIVHLAGRVDLLPHVRDLIFERPAVLGDGFQGGKRSADAADVCARQRHRVEKFGECQQPQRLERAAFHGKRRDNRVQVVGCLQRKRRIGIEILDAFGGGRQQLAHVMGIGLRLQLREPRGAERCDRKAANERDDLIPFKGAEGDWVHATNG